MGTIFRYLLFIKHTGSNRLKLSTICMMVVTTFILAAVSQETNASRIGFLGAWDRSLPMIERASRETNIPVSFVKIDELLIVKKEMKDYEYDVLYILNLPVDKTVPLLRAIKHLKARYPKLKIIPLDHRDTHVELQRVGLLTKDPKVSPYWRANGLTNMRRLLQYTAVTYLDMKGEIEPPAAIPDYGYYHPSSKDIFSTLTEFREKITWNKKSPVAALLIQQSFWITQDTKVIDAEIRGLEKEGFHVVTIFGHSGKKISQMVSEFQPDIVIEDRHGSIWEGDGEKSFLEKLNVPYLRPISMLAYTIDQWKKDPRGLAHRDVGHFMTLQEFNGTIEPIVVGGLKASIHGFRLHEPVPDRIERFSKRAAKWVKLKRKPNQEKRIAIVYYNRSVGKDDLMRGSPTGAFLDAPKSLVHFLPRMKSKGFTVDPIPKDPHELLAWVKKRGRNIGPWAQGELEEMADQPDTVMIPQSKFEKWLAEKLTQEHRKKIEKHFGPSPGKLMVVERNKKKYIVLPGVRLGNILLACLPMRGEKQDSKLLHSRDVPPPYNYLAFYWWLEEEFKADAVVHWGTHGTVELLPGKEAGLSKDDWGDICVGTMPIVNPWIMDNLGEATLSRRRSYALLIDHLVPPAVNAGLTDELRTVHDDIDKFVTLEEGLLREEFRKRITQGTHKTRVDETLKLESITSRSLTDDEIEKVAHYLHDVYNSTTPTTLHVLGLPPDDKRLAAYLVSILRHPFLDRLEKVMPVPKEEDLFEGDKYKWLRKQAEVLIAKTVLGNDEPPEELRKDILHAREMYARFNKTDHEIVNCLRALQGEFILPGPGPDPIRNPSSIPSGRNLYTLNPEEIPSKASWEVAVKLVDEMLRKKRPKKVGLDLNGMNTMRDYGVMEAQILYLMGVRPVWNRNNLVVDVEIISQKELGRPRIDVFIAMGGMYKENFPTRVLLLDKAIRLVSKLKEKDNLIRSGTQQQEQRLLARGFSNKIAKKLAAARIFGTKPGNTSGTNILHLVPRSGVWKTDDEISSVYIDNMSFVYTGDVWGKKVEGLYQEAIQGTDTIVRVWASNMTSQLSNHHAYEYLGGLSMAVTKLTGKEPDALIADVRDPDGARLRDFEEVLATNLRTELLNRKWIEGMKEHDYAGAGMMAELVKNTFGWDVTRSSSVSDGVWNDIYATYIDDRYQLDLREWFEKENPHAMQEIAATMLEASRKGYWNASDEMIRKLSRLYAESVVKHGPSAGLVSGGNKDLEKYITKQLNAPGDIELVGNYQQAEARSIGKSSQPRVFGTKLENVTKEQTPDIKPNTFQITAYIALTLAVVFFFIGIWKRIGSPA